MTFVDVRFPTDISYGSSGGPGFKTQIIALASGAEHRVSKWATARRTFNVAYGVRSYSQLSNVYEFYLARQGSAHGFRFKDWFDYTSKNPGTGGPSSEDQLIGQIDGGYSSGDVTLQLRKNYLSTPTTYQRSITKPVANTTTISVNDVTLASGGGAVWEVSTTTGIVTLHSGFAAGDVIKAGYEFDVPVRFSDTADEGISLRMDDFSNASTSIELVELVGEDGTLAGDFFYGGAKNLGTLSGDVSIGVQDGRVIVFASDSNSRKLKLPYHEDGSNNNVIPLGGPYFYLINTSGSFEIDVYENDGATSVGSVPANSERTVVLGVNASSLPTWYLVP